MADKRGDDSESEDDGDFVDAGSGGEEDSDSGSDDEEDGAGAGEGEAKAKKAKRKRDDDDSDSSDDSDSDDDGADCGIDASELKDIATKVVPRAKRRAAIASGIGDQAALEDVKNAEPDEDSEAEFEF